MRRRQRVFDDMLDAAREQADAAEAGDVSHGESTNGRRSEPPAEQDDPPPSTPVVEPEAPAPAVRSTAGEKPSSATPPEGHGAPADPLQRLRALQEQNRTPQVELFGVKVPASRSQDTVFTFSFRLPEELRYVIQARCGELRISHQDFGRLAVEMLLSEIEANGDPVGG